MTAPPHDTVPSSIAWSAPHRRWLVQAAVLLLASLWVAPTARAATLAGVDVPDTLQIDGYKLVLNGLGLRTLTFLKVKIYVAALYLPKKTANAQAILASPGPKVIALHHIHSGSKGQVQDRYREGEKVNCGGGGCDAALQADFERLVASAGPVDEGDVTLYIVTDKSFRVVFNGREVIAFTGNRLGNMIIEGFIGAHPPSETLRAGLLGVPMP
jgi:chalcone isomerase-like protein